MLSEGSKGKIQQINQSNLINQTQSRKNKAAGVSVCAESNPGPYLVSDDEKQKGFLNLTFEPTLKNLEVMTELKQL